MSTTKRTLEEMQQTLQEHGTMLRTLLDNHHEEWVLSKKRRSNRADQQDQDQQNQQAAPPLNQQLRVLEVKSNLPKTPEVRKMLDGELRSLWERIGTLGKLRRNASTATMRRKIVAYLNNESSS